jgi:glutamine amidotransferase
MTATQIAIIDYGMGNLHSVASALQHVAPEANAVITSDSRVIANADRVIFPGVGAIRDCMAEIRRLKMDAAVANAVASGKPVLGICVGMQALMSRSEENGGVDCLDILPGEVKAFAADAVFQSGAAKRLKVPHMGWNQVTQSLDHPLWANIESGSRFYFVHSYYVRPQDESAVAGACHYGLPFAAALSRDNLFAAQFHPEKSHTSGLQLLRNFCYWNGQL